MKGKALAKKDVEKVSIEDTETLNKIADFFRITIPLAPTGNRKGPWTACLCINRLKRPFAHDDLERFAEGEIYQYSYKQDSLDDEKPRLFYTMAKNGRIRSISPAMAVQ